VTKKWLLSVLLLLLGALPLEAIPQEGGKRAPDGRTELTCDLPASQRRVNVGGRDGAGLCVFTSIEYAAKWQGERALYDFQDKMRRELGGGWPEKVDQMIAKYAPGTQYLQDTSGDPDILRAILASGRMACVTYAGRDSHYGSNKTIAHMVCLVAFGDQWACISDNNFIRDDQFMWMTPQEFISRWKANGGGWVVCLLAPPPPPPPHN
jgi:hypothetical protein